MLFQREKKSDEAGTRGKTLLSIASAGGVDASWLGNEADTRTIDEVDVSRPSFELADSLGELVKAAREIESEWPQRTSSERRNEILDEVKKTALAQPHGPPQTSEHWKSLIRARIAQEKGKAVRGRPVRDE